MSLCMIAGRITVTKLSASLFRKETLKFLQDHIGNIITMNLSNLTETNLANTYPSPLDIRSSLSVVIYITVIFVIGVPGNIMVLLVEAKIRNKTAADWIVFNLAVCDLVFCLIMGPAFPLFYYGMPVYLLEIPAKLYVYILHSLIYSSMLLICVIMAERYIKTCRPGCKLLCAKRVKKVCIIAHGVALVTATPSPFLYHANQNGQFVLNISNQYSRNLLKIFYGYQIIGFLIVFLIVFALTLLIVRGIYKSGRIEPHSDSTGGNSLRTQEGNHDNGVWTTACGARNRTQNMAFRSTNQIKRQNTTTAILLAISVIFVACWVPVWIMFLLWSVDPDRIYGINSTLFWFIRHLYYVNHCLNPVLFNCFNRRFRMYTISVLTCQHGQANE